MSNTPLPNSDGSIWVDGAVKSGYTFQTMKDYAAAVSAERDARIKVPEEQLAVAAMQLINAIGYIEEARAALGDKNG